MLAIQPPSPRVTLSSLLQTSPASEARYAIYFMPPETSAWWRFGCEWLGRDAITGAPARRQNFAALDDNQIDRITRAPSLYGFHATLKAPLRLAPGCTPRDLHELGSHIAISLTPVLLTPLRLEVVDGFVALTLGADDACMVSVAAIARQCVTVFDHLRAPTNAAELRRRENAGLNPRQKALLHQWGYPFVFEEFRFHMTLSGRLEPQDQMQLINALTPVVQKLNREPLMLDTLSVCVQTRRDAPFVVASRHGFEGSVRSYGHD